MSKPRILDLFCGAGGAAKGYQEAGFYVVGVDQRPMPNYCGERFVQADALEILESLTTGYWNGEQWLDCFAGDPAAIHVSPPCQASANVTLWRGSQDDHPELIPETRQLLEATGLPYVIENVPEAAIRHDFLLCGSMFGLPIKRHRAFETNWPAPFMRMPCHHKKTDLAFEHKNERAYADAMGCEWMTVRESRQAIPPAYCHHIGQALRIHLAGNEAEAGAKAETAAIKAKRQPNQEQAA